MEINFNNLNEINKFDKNNFPDLDLVVLAALEKFIKDGLGDVEFPKFKNPIVGASVNALTTAKILLGNNAIYCDENDFEEVVKSKFHLCDGAIVFSASGGKHAPILAKKFLENGLETYLVTCTQNSQAQSVVGKNKTIVTPKIREPYTYNTSTYLGWVLQKTRESASEIYDFILNKVEPTIPRDIGNHFGYYLLVPNNATQIGKLFDVKFEELFGTLVPWQTHTFETSKHAKTVISPQYTLKFGKGKLPVNISKEKIFDVPLPKKFDLGLLMAVGYYVIGKIQKNKQPYFKENIENYIDECKKREFASSVNLIVEVDSKLKSNKGSISKKNIVKKPKKSQKEIIYIASDHAGFVVKDYIKKILSKLGLKFEDLGTNSSTKSVDYPIFAKGVASEVSKNLNSKGILICGSGTGMQIEANRFPKIRASFCFDEYGAKMARLDNDSNVLCLRAREFDHRDYEKIVKTFLETKFSGEQRHKRRIDML